MSGRFTPSTVLWPQTNIDAYPFSAHNGLLSALPFILFVCFSLQETKQNPAIKLKLTPFLSWVRRTTHSVTTLAWRQPKALPLAFWMSKLTRADLTFTPIWANALNQAAPLDPRLWSDTPHQAGIQLCELPSDVMMEKLYAVGDVWKSLSFTCLDRNDEAWRKHTQEIMK